MKTMKSIFATLCVLVVATPTAFGQTPAQRAAQVHRGHVKMWTGAALLAGGFVIVPPTAAVHSTPHDAAIPVAAVGLMFAGGSLMYLGGRDVQRARRPALTFGVSVGRSSALQVRRNW